MKLTKQWFHILTCMLSVLFLAALSSLAYIGFFSRYWYDDFFTSVILREKGFIGSQKYWYANWSGRFAFYISVNLAEMVGPKIVPFLPSIALIVWLTATTWTIYRILLSTRLTHRLACSFLLAVFLIFVILNSAPDIVQSLYWQTGMLTYLLPLVLWTIYIGLFMFALQRHAAGRSILSLLLIKALIIFFTGGLSEVSSILQLSLLSLLTLVCLLYVPAPLKRTMLSLTVPSLLVAVLAFTILVRAPGNKIRQSGAPPQPTMISAIKSSVTYSLRFVERQTRRPRSTAILSLIFPAWLVFASRLSDSNKLKTPPASNLRIKRFAEVVTLCSVFGFLLIVVCFVPGYYSLSESLPLRAQIIPQFILVTSMIGLSMYAGVIISDIFSVRRKHKTVLFIVTTATVALLMVISPIISTRDTFALGPKAKAYASAWDELERQMRSAREQGRTDLIIPRIGSDQWELGFGRPEMFPTREPTDSQNRCVAEYYGLKSVKIE